jgi:hypothetical protein
MIGESETKKERSSQRWVLKGQQPEIFLLFELFDFYLGLTLTTSSVSGEYAKNF